MDKSLNKTTRKREKLRLSRVEPELQKKSSVIETLERYFDEQDILTILKKFGGLDMLIPQNYNPFLKLDIDPERASAYYAEVRGDDCYFPKVQKYMFNENAVIRLYNEGYTIKQVANRLAVAERTIWRHLKKIKKRQ